MCILYCNTSHCNLNFSWDSLQALHTKLKKTLDPPGGGGDPKGVGILVVSLKGVNYGITEGVDNILKVPLRVAYTARKKKRRLTLLVV